jgi:leucyl-tRNA synthetase
MHKSKGNFITLRNAVEQYGADSTRCALLLGAEGMDDPDWRGDNVHEFRGKLETWHRLIESIVESAKDEKVGHLENWLISTLQHRIQDVTENIQVMKTRTALDTVLFEVWNDFRWYLRRKNDANSKALIKALDTWLRLLAPFAPHISEEVWSKLGNEGFISLASWPHYDETKVNVKVEETEGLIKNVLEDTQNIIRATRITPKKIHYYVATPWKWKAHQKALEKAISAKATQSELMKELLKEPDLKSMSKQVANFVGQVVDEVNRMSEERKERQLKAGVIDEKEALSNAEDFLKRELKAKVFIYSEEDSERHDPKERAHLAKPYRPAIYME